jgi:TetR/AcrR family transcriptional regulator, transcriptional repressor for nem operon
MEPIQDRKRQSHARIVEAASRALRARGYAGVGVADVMREAGLTHGGFYAHFPSRDALLVAALEHAGRASAESVLAGQARGRDRGVSPFRTLINSYLHDKLLAECDGGCPVAAVASEMPRQEGALRDASAARVRALIRAIAKVLPAEVPADRANTVAATMVGALQLGRTLGPNAEGRSVLATTRDALLDQYDRA